MLEIRGKYNTAIVFADNIEESAARQIKELCDQEFVRGSKIRIMPDVHTGAGCTIGTTMTVTDKVVPNLVGVDIGCGLEVARLARDSLDLARLDKLIRERIPSGFAVRKREHPFNEEIDLDQLRCRDHVDLDRARLSIGTLGGGNHFIEVNKDSQGKLYLVIHSGSRHLGLEVANYYQREAYRQLLEQAGPSLGEHLSGKQRKKLQKQAVGIPRALAYTSGRLFADYIHDMKIIQRFAALNRRAMVWEILRGMDLEVTEQFTTIHNYIDTDRMILRKGAVSAQRGEKLIIPINMRDGSLICIGKGNPDWNYSAPHGAGRLMSRTEARRSLSLSQYRELMEGIYTTSVNKNTLDECPLVYKPMAEIIENVQDTVEILEIIRPVYNFKDAG
ncbi:MAG TPA: RtcB family protein [Bacillota bacterium]|nr:RtcB family protein [Bacillota bacterium]HPZ89737.1 RtcB family protein [Bacillota bacterium]HQE01247.1 RtcB family protein [Bacillota bacterium]